MTLAELVTHFEALEERAAVAPEEMAELTAPILIENAKGVIGHTAFLRDLLPSTQADRVSKGYSPNDPLKRSGEFQDSIEGGVEPEAVFGAIAFTGSNSPLAAYFEHGTAHMAPFANFAVALEETLPEVKANVGIVARKLMSK